MSVRQYESFLANCFLTWVVSSIQPGLRYQFKSPDATNSLNLYRALAKMAGDQRLQIDGLDLPCIACNGVQLLPVLHGEGEYAFTENYISHLRDQVASRSGSLANTALLIIHNSMLDTLINSARDIAAPGAIWHPVQLMAELASLIRPGADNGALSKCLLDDQLAMIIEEGATVFGFAPVFRSLEDSSLDFIALGLFNDPMILNMSGQNGQIRRRLDENRELRREIDFDVEHYSDQLESMLTKLSPKFITEHFESKKDWASLDFEVYLNEMKANLTQKLILEKIEYQDGPLLQRAKSATKPGQREISLLAQVPAAGMPVDLEFTFLGSDLMENQVVLKHNNVVRANSSHSISRAGGKYSRLRLSVPFDGTPSFFSVELKRDNRAEDYKFRILLVEKGFFYLDEVRNCFRIEPHKTQLTLQIEENQVQVAPQGSGVYTLEADQEVIDCQNYTFVDFEALANQSEMVQFTIQSGTYRLKINIEGPNAEGGVTLPLLFDQERLTKLFKHQGNAEYNSAKHRVIIDNSELTIVGVRMQLLEFEAEMVAEHYVYVGENGTFLTVESIEVTHPLLSKAYQGLFAYFERYSTLPSLVAWDDAYCALVTSLLDAFELELDSIPLNQVLNLDQKALLRMGIHHHEDNERISPIHPLVLAFHLQLVQAIRKEFAEHGSSSFAELPVVTLNRLVASGMLPLVYHGEHDYAHIIPVKENSFWLDIVPQRQVSHSFVKRLVRDKLAEFTTAYSRLFTRGGNSELIINAINQGSAEELFLGIVDYFKRQKEKATAIHVNCYDDRLLQNKFDEFAEAASYDVIKSWFGLSTGPLRAEADLLIDLIRSRLTFSKFVTPAGSEKLAYAHLAFFSNNVPVDCRPVNIEEALSGVLCNGLLAGEASETQGDAYFTAFGLRHVEVAPHRTLRLAQLLGALWQPARQNNCQYLGQGIGLAVNSAFKHLLTRSYDSALWTTIIDPKVNLDFFTSQKDLVLIHYSDQYTSSAGYDAITVTRQVDLFQRLLKKDSQVQSDRLLSEFNAFNGEWLLKMLTVNAKERKEKHGIIGAYKFVSAMLQNSDICWVPLSVAEMIRVSGNVGLKISESDFSRLGQGYRKGAISDDVLFVGFKGDCLYLMPLEVKTGARPDYNHAGEQARELKRYLVEDILGPKTLASCLYRALFIRQVLMQVEKFRLYHVLEGDGLEPLLSRREWWLKGDYQLGELPDFVEGMVLAHIESDSFFEPHYQETSDRILQIELPYALLKSLIDTASGQGLNELVSSCKVPVKYILGKSIEVDIDSKEAQCLALGQEGGPTIPLASGPNAQMPLPLGNPDLVEVKTEVEAEGPLRVLFGHDSVRQSPLHWEPTNTAKFMNTNTGIIGTMGTGKTQFTKSVVTQLVRQQACNVGGAPIGMLIFDYKSDYVDDAFLEATGGHKHNLYKLPYNPLSLYGDTPMLPVHTAAGFAETMTKAYGLGKKQQMRLETLILECYLAAGIHPEDPSTWDRVAPTIEDVWQGFMCQEKVEEDSLFAALSKLARFKIFEEDPTKLTSLYQFMDGVTVIELSGYPEEVKNLIVALTLDLFYSQMHKHGKPKVQGDYRQVTKLILVDEADNFMKQDFQSLRRILKEGREYGVGVILSTQEITHFKTGENNYASYILTWVVHRVAEIKNADIKSIFNIDDKSDQDSLMETIRRLEKHFSLYVDGSKRVQKMRDRAFWEL